MVKQSKSTYVDAINFKFKPYISHKNLEKSMLTKKKTFESKKCHKKHSEYSFNSKLRIR